MSVVESIYAELKQQELKKNPFSCLHMAHIDINPHQIEAFTFALSSLELGGAILADEVGLGKTIEAGLVIKYLLCSGKNKILLIMPSNLRKQWQVELEEKFDIESLIVDSSNWDDYLTKVKCNQAVIIVSYHFASKRKEEFARIPWDFCVYDEAHRLRNVHKNGSKMANSLYELTKGIPKILLTATPMQNTLFDMYGLVYYIDDKIFYSKSVFSERYLRNEDYGDLKTCLESIVQRTLRKEVAEYIQFSERKEMTIDFKLSPMEIELYMMINNYLKKEILYALPNSHRTLITSVIRKLLASSSMAVAETFKVLKERLEVLKETTRTESADESIDFFLSFFNDDEIETDDDSKQDELYTREKVNEFIQHEIDEVTAIINKAESIKKNAKMTALKQAVEKAFSFQEEAGIKQRIVVFTESIRTQQYMYEELSRAGYEGQILKFNGNMNDPVTKQIYKAWKARNYGKYIGSRNVEIKNAIVEAFREEYRILLVTDSGSEGLNLQFCNTIINYDLPWNPQKIEQRIGRCHRYGQKNDVVVINLLNTQNVADKRVYEILSEKFELFQGVFGASDKAIGLLESGADFEKRVTLIYQECKTASDFTKQFKDLEKELEKKRNKKIDELKSIFIYKTEEEHKSHFNSILQEIYEYDSQLDYWNDRKCEKVKVTYPQYYEVNVDLGIPGIQQGYLLIGGLYADSSIEEAVFEIVDETGKIYGVTDLLARTLCEKLQETILKESIPNNQMILSYIDKVDEFMQQKYAESKRALIVANQKKMSNWLQLRKEEYLLKVKDTSELDDIKEKYADESDFRQKIALKKQIEVLEEQKQKLIEAFHDEMSALEEDATNMQKEFEERILVKPQLVTKIVIKF
ncbi:MAG: DISARM system SNF2-like helicase DrmD [Lachnospiraceae bacterium]|nr:DISARM system SNF2-like helicase DrmD [Lachnospiraceae bacterium]